MAEETLAEIKNPEEFRNELEQVSQSYRNERSEATYQALQEVVRRALNETRDPLGVKKIFLETAGKENLTTYYAIADEYEEKLNPLLQEFQQKFKPLADQWGETLSLSEMDERKQITDQIANQMDELITHTISSAESEEEVETVKRIAMRLMGDFRHAMGVILKNVEDEGRMVA